MIPQYENKIKEIDNELQSSNAKLKSADIDTTCNFLENIGN